MLLVTGCPRSGTGFMSTVLINRGLDMPHERVGTRGSVCWLYAVEATSYPLGVPMPPPWRHVVHQVRDPLSTIASLSTISQSAWDFMDDHISGRFGEGLSGYGAVDWCAVAWWRWNQLAEAKAAWTYRVEKPPLKRIAALAGHSRPGPIPPSIVNARKHAKVTWAQISPPIRLKCQEMAERYGYKIENAL